ncbi:FMN-binding negative transcriptional regulator [Massilia glaciei]|uniref:FMN-binding negative transcriptional regulator n=1 Tax=Massilia glaciei TaxID=1524097 RepID=A0A2U2HII2_9BURK|nr:FMN-binding negative transcriptional regulator [Massilia glaciei]PWF46104.1 FMN-binding negative transcriptional regulator [Massilia glaciei]
MYGPKHFDESHIDVMHGLIGTHPLGTLVMHGAAGLSADHIPFEIAAPASDAPFGVLRAHVARANPLWRQGGQQALVVFQGPGAYISPAHYAEKAISGKVVPTWNYAAVHAHGTLRAIEDPAWLLALLERLTARHEGTRAMPWSVHDAPRDYVDQLLKAIVGIEIPLERMQGKWKVSQNRSQQDQDGIAAGLADDPFAALMRQRRGA